MKAIEGLHLQESGLNHLDLFSTQFCENCEFYTENLTSVQERSTYWSTALVCAAFALCDMLSRKWNILHPLFFASPKVSGGKKKSEQAE